MKTLLLASLLSVSAVAAQRPQVKLGGALGARFDLTVTNNFMKLDLAKDFFKPFVDRTTDGGFIGLGKLADAAVHFAANSSDPAVAARKDEIINFIISHQLPDGYTGFFRPDARLEKLWDIHEMGFIVQGLMSEWECFGNKKALDAARRNVDYVIDRWPKMKDNWEFVFITDRETTLGFGFGVARLYAATKDEKYRRFLRNERSLDLWDDPIVIGRDKMIYGQSYGYLGSCLEQLELYRWDPRPAYLRPSLRALEFQTRGEGVLVNGNGGIAECWTNDQDGEGAVGETCNVAFELLFWDALAELGVADESLTGDLMERAIYNSLFAAQSEDGRRLRYYVPLCGVRKFWPNDMYCCPNNFRRAMARLPEYVFRVSENRVSANLYSSCSAALEVNGAKVRIAEETAYPKCGRVKFALEPERDVAFTLSLRLPKWCANPEVKINGVRVTYKRHAGMMLNLPRVWRKGDVVEADFPMSVRTVRGRKRQSGRFAVLRGPVLFALDTRSVKALAEMHPHDAQTVMTVDPNRLAYDEASNSVSAVASTAEWAVGIADLSVDGKPPANVAKLSLVPFERENCTLTYFRAPNIEDDCRADDELFGPAATR